MADEQVQLRIRQFDPSTIPKDRICVMIGKRGTGKSTLVADILSSKTDIPCGIVCSGSEESNDFYKQHVPNSFVYDGFQLNVFRRFLEQQRVTSQKWRNGEFTGDPHAFAIFDDCMYDKHFSKHMEIRQLFYNGRHRKIFAMVTMQYCLDMGPDLRTNTDFVFILREPIQANRERIWRQWAGIFPTYAAFSSAMDVLTEDFGCMVINNISTSNKIEDVVFWYKATPGKEFRIGSPSFWRFHSANYNSHYQQEEEQRQQDSGASKRASYRVSKISHH